MIPHFSALARRSSMERRWLAAAIATYVVVEVVRRMCPAGPVWRWLIAAPVEGRRSVATAAEREIIWAVDTAATLLPFGGNCLTNAVTAHRLLSAAGGCYAVRFGVARVAGEVVPRAHAWVECAGRIVIGRDTSIEYRPLSARRSAS